MQIIQASLQGAFSQAIGKKMISLYGVSGGRADSVYGDVPGDCFPYGTDVAQKVSDALRCINPQYFECGKGCDRTAYLVFDSCVLDESIASNRDPEPNTSGLWRGWSTFVQDPTRTFYSLKPIYIYPEQDWSDCREESFWLSIEEPISVAR